MTTTGTADQFGHLLRTVDPASLGTEDKLALISLLQRCLGTDESRIADGDGGAWCAPATVLDPRHRQRRRRLVRRVGTQNTEPGQQGRFTDPAVPR